VRILIAPDKFKGCLSAADVADAIARGVRAADPAAEVIQIPMADGGEGTVDALVAATGGRHMTTRVTGPLPEMTVDAAWGVLGDGRTAVIEMAAASGLALLSPDQYDPMKTTTYGTGELLMTAIRAGAERVILGIGGSATIDAGLGCVQACGGIPVLKSDPEQLPARRPVTGADLGDLLWITWVGDRRFRDRGVELTVACDVDNPLAGPRGAACTFGPQKGATPEQVERLDAALARLGRIVRAPGLNADTPGAGAAGGMGFGLVAFLSATLAPGFDIVADAVNLRGQLATGGFDLVITGEGRLDASSLNGKTAIGVARLCKQLNIPCAALVGAIGEGAEWAAAEGLSTYQTINPPGTSLADAIRQAPEALERAASELVRSIAAP
jgi:glycerate 2-kinase